MSCVYKMGLYKNWLESLYSFSEKDEWSQNGEGLLLDFIFRNLYPKLKPDQCQCIDIGGGDGKYLSNTAYLKSKGWSQVIFDKENGDFITTENAYDKMYGLSRDILSIDIDGNDYWILNDLLFRWSALPSIIIAEFNPAFTDSRAIKYNPTHEWAGDDYYGFSFEAGKKLAERHGYEIIFNVANMNLIMVRKDLINVTVPPVTYKQDNFFKASNRPDSDWVWI